MSDMAEKVAGAAAQERRSEALGITAVAGVSQYLEVEYGPCPTSSSVGVA